MARPWTVEEEKRLVEIIDRPYSLYNWWAAAIELKRGALACKARYWMIRNRPMAKTCVIHCDYQEFSPSTYKGMRVKVDGEEHLFFGKGPEKDLEEAKAFGKERADLVYTASSVDHFFLNQGPRAEASHDTTLP